MPIDPVRDAAVDVLLRVFEQGAYLNRALDTTLRRKQLSARGKRFLTQLVYGTVRHRGLADHVLAKLVRQPLSELPPPILAILRMGVFQALFLNQVTFPAMVHTSVDLAKKRGHAGTARLVNAVLNRAPQRMEDVKFPGLKQAPVEYLSARCSIAPWIAEAWIAQFGVEQAERMAAASAEEAPRTLRVNTRTTTREALIAELAAVEVVAEAHPLVPDAVTVVSGSVPTRGKAFAEGHFFIQDPASMLASHLLEPKAGERVLDLCAAPGGKTTHLAQLADDAAFVVAAELHASKSGLVRENALRLGLRSIRCVAADALQPPFRGDYLFQRVLVDAPCTGLGTLRRHPELKYRVQPEDAARLAELQYDLLRSALALCENGGVVVYSVCTVTREETELVVARIVEDGGVSFEDGPGWLSRWKTSTGQYRVVPGDDRLDGYFLTRFRKAS